MKHKITLLLSLFLFLSCQTTKVEKKMFNGMIYDGNNEPLSGVTIQIDCKDVTITDMYGRFYIDNLSSNKDYILTAKKTEYETIDFHFTFQNITQVVYLTMYSSSQLLEKAEQALLEKDTVSAQEYLKRTDNTIGKNTCSEYLKAVIAYNQNDYQNAINILNTLITDGDKNPYIYLFLADIYQYTTQDLDSAKKSLEQYLKNNYDLNVQKRYNDLCSMQ